MLKPKRIHRGLEIPLQPFYTNHVDFQNREITELLDFIATMQTVIINQKHEIERTAVEVGEYQVVDEYKHFKISHKKVLSNDSSAKG